MYRRHVGQFDFTPTSTGDDTDLAAATKVSTAGAASTDDWEWKRCDDECGKYYRTTLRDGKTGAVARIANGMLEGSAMRAAPRTHRSW